MKNFYLFILMMFTAFIVWSPVLNAQTPASCTCWYLGYKAKVVGHSRETAQATTFFQECAGKSPTKAPVGNTEDYLRGWKAAEEKAQMHCPYTAADSSESKPK